MDILFNWESQDFFQSLIINANKNFNLKSSSKAFDHIELNATTRICLEIFQIMVFVIFSIHTLFFSLQKLLLRSISQIAINNISLFPIFIFIWRTNIFTIRVNNQKSVFFCLNLMEFLFVRQVYTWGGDDAKTFNQTYGKKCYTKCSPDFTTCFDLGKLTLSG